MSKKCVIYARQSSGVEEDSASVEQQILNCQKLANDKGFEVIGVFQDLNASGKTYPNTPEALQLAAKDKEYQSIVGNFGGKRAKKFRTGLANAIALFDKINYLLIDDKTRLYRPITGSFLDSYMLQVFKQFNVMIYSAKEGVIDFNKFADHFVLDIENKVNDNQLKKTRAKSMQALQVLKDSGYRTTGADFRGYRHAGKQQVVIVEEEANLVKEAFAMCLNGTSYNNICIEINAKYNLTIKYAELLKILSRPEYAGYQYNSKKELIPSKVFTPIIDLNTFFEAQKRITNKKKFNRDKKNVYSCTGLVYCGSCGNRLNVFSSNALPKSREKGRLHYFSCADKSYQQYNQKCALSSIRYSYQTDDYSGLHEGLMPLVVKQLIKHYQAALTAKADQNKSAEIKMQIDKLNRFKGELDALRLEEIISLIEYKDKIVKINQELKVLQDDLLKVESFNSSKADELKKMCVIALGEIKHQKLSDVLYKKLLQELVEKIIVNPYSVKVLFNDGTDLEIERVPHFSIRCLPKWSINFDDNIDFDKITPDTPLELTYYYKSFDADETENVEQHTIYACDGFTVQTLGRNPKPYEYITKKHPKRLSECKRRILENK